MLQACVYETCVRGQSGGKFTGQRCAEDVKEDMLLCQARLLLREVYL